MTIVLNLAGGPGTGKSGVAGKVYGLLKERHMNVELVPEYAKTFAWEERKPVTNDQFYFFGKQARREYVLHKRVDVIITDAPLFICCYYSKVYGTEAWNKLFQDMYRTFRATALADGIQYVDVFLGRTGPYQPQGRFQTAEEAYAIDVDLRTYLETSLGLTLRDFPASPLGSDQLVDLLVDLVDVRKKMLTVV